MFEKEAEKWTIDYVCKDCSRYKECKSKEHCTCKNCSKEKWQNGAEFGYNKANEWHYVKDGDLPKKENLECLCIIRPMKEECESFENKDFRGVLYFKNGRFYLDEDNSNDCLKETNSDFTNLVIAWKEIVLPKENE